jgi:hypothetical protein
MCEQWTYASAATLGVGEGPTFYLTRRAIEILGQEARARMERIDRDAVDAIKGDIDAERFNEALQRFETGVARGRFYDDAVALIPMQERVACVRTVLDGRFPMVSVRRALRMFETAPLLRDTVPQSLPDVVTVFRAVRASHAAQARYRIHHVLWHEQPPAVTPDCERVFIGEARIARQDISAMFDGLHGSVIVLNPHALTELSIVETAASQAA